MGGWRLVRTVVRFFFPSPRRGARPMHQAAKRAGAAVCGGREGRQSGPRHRLVADQLARATGQLRRLLVWHAVPSRRPSSRPSAATPSLAAAVVELMLATC
jgi:hypothetical protein